MRNIGFTIILALLAVLVCGLAGWQWTHGNFNTLLGAPPTPVGERLYSNFSQADVKFIEISQNSVLARFDLGEKGWYASLPWKDRMDPRAAVSIIEFSLGLRVEDFAARDDIDAQKAGLRESGTDIRLEGANHQLLAKYKLGRQTPWLATMSGAEKPVPTVFIQPRDAIHKRFIYSCTGNIGPLFKDGLKYLRDHHPLYFNPITVQKIRVLAEQGDLTLGRESPKTPWRVVKPLDLATDPKAMKVLLEGLYELQAVRISDRASVTLPKTGAVSKSKQIAITSFGSDVETVLDIFPPETPESRVVRATVSDRPDTLFDLPIKPEPDIVTLANLPLAVNDLREPTLTNLNIASLRGILIQPTTGSQILISRNPPKPWIASIEGQSQEANEERLYTLLKSVTQARAIGFETDAATDFTPWGLNRPFLKLRFLGQDNQGLELAFGVDGKGGYFVNRTGTPTVMRVDPSMVSSIPVKPYEWRHSLLWSIDRTNLMAIERGLTSEAPLRLRYIDNQADAWTATRNDKDVTASLDLTRTNYMFGILEGLKVTRWLSPDDASATTALENPSLMFKVFEKSRDENGEIAAGLTSRELILAPATQGANPGFYYGRLTTETNLFLLDRETYGKLAMDLMEK